MEDRKIRHSGERGRSADRPKDIPRKGWRDILLRTKSELKNDNLSVVAAGVAFFLLLSIAPALVAAISIYGLIADPAQIQAQFEQISNVMPAEASEIVEKQMTGVASEGIAGWGAALGLLVALWTAAKGVKAMMSGLNIAYDESESRGFFKLNGTAIALTIGAVIAGLLCLGLIALLPAILGKLGLGSVAETFVSLIRWPALLALALFFMAALYRYAPDRDKVQWKWLSVGSVFAVALWLLGSALFSYYVSNFGSYNKTYGSLGAVVILMMWLYLSAYVLLLGAELNAEIEHQTARDTTEGKPEPLGQRGAYVADTVGEEQ